MPSIEFEVYCECGELLNGKEIRAGVEVEPCDKCLEIARKEGWDEGYEERDKEGE